MGPGARDAAYVRIQCRHGGNMVGSFARINYCFVRDGGREFRKLVNLDIINTAYVDVQLA